MKNPLVSVVIPTYNKKNWIRETLESVANQTYTEWECVLVDNGSTDGTIEEIANFVGSHSGNWKIIRLEDNIGPSGARNAGILASRGDFIALLDGDDLWSPDKIAFQVKFMQDNIDVALTLTSFLVFSKAPKRIRFVGSKSVRSLIHGWLSMSGFGGLVESTGMFRKSELNPSLLFDKAYMGSEGLDFVIKWNAQKKVSFLSDPLTYYRISENQLHTNEEAIKENMQRLTRALSLSQPYKSKISKSQEAYFFVSSVARGVISVRLIIESVNPYRFFSRLNIIAHLLLRNAVSFTKGLKYRNIF